MESEDKECDLQKTSKARQTKKTKLNEAVENSRAKVRIQ